MIKTTIKGLAEFSPIPLTGAIRQQTSVPGNYLLRLTVNDLAANKIAVEQTVFTIK